MRGQLLVGVKKKQSFSRVYIFEQDDGKMIMTMEVQKSILGNGNVFLWGEPKKIIK